jgi:tetratricopeptide (TPR) repeat protein
MEADEDDLRWPALDDREGPALPLEEARARAMIHAALAPEAAPVPLRPAPRGRRMRPLLLVAAALLLAGAAAAGVWAARRAPRPTPPAPPGALGSAPSRAAPEPSASAASEAPVEAPAPAETSTSAPTDAPLPAAPASGKAPARAVDPGALLERANALRAAKRWREAEAAYRLVLQLAPGSPEAQTARVAAADLRLHQLQDPAGAEALFGKAQQQGGALGEEAAWGIAESHRARGDRAGERRALERFLAAFPSSAMAPRARSRLAELGRP